MDYLCRPVMVPPQQRRGFPSKIIRRPGRMDVIINLMRESVS